MLAFLFLNSLLVYGDESTQIERIAISKMINIELGNGYSVKTEEYLPSVIISISKEGKYYLGTNLKNLSTAIKLLNLKSKIVNVAKQNEIIKFNTILRVDSNCPFIHVQKLMSHISKLGITRIYFATLQPLKSNNNSTEKHLTKP